MKNLFYTFIALFITVGSFAQNNNTYKQSLDKLLEARNGSDIFERIVDSNINNIPTDKQAKFRQKVTAAAEKVKRDAVAHFTSKYSLDDINEIYTEFTTDGKIDYSQKTLTFIREWRNYKGQFQKRFKEIYQEL